MFLCWGGSEFQSWEAECSEETDRTGERKKTIGGSFGGNLQKIGQLIGDEVVDGLQR